MTDLTHLCDQVQARSAADAMAVADPGTAITCGASENGDAFDERGFGAVRCGFDADVVAASLGCGAPTEVRRTPGGGASPGFIDVEIGATRQVAEQRHEGGGPGPQALTGVSR